MGSTKDALIFTFALFGCGIIIDIHNIYYLKVFIQKYHLPSNYLNIVQVLYLVWNAINDPLLGYVQDLGVCNIKWIMDRQKVILYGGPVFAASFLLFWFPWSTSVGWIVGIHLLISLFIYDTLFTLVLSAYCGLCIEKSAKHEDRVRILVYMELFGLIAGLTVWPLEYLTHNLDDFRMFQIITVFLAIFATGCLVFSAKFTKPPQLQVNPEEVELQEGNDEKKKSKGLKKIWTISWEIVRELRFICLVMGQFFKILRFMVNELFLLIFVESLLVRPGFFEKGSIELPIYYVVVRSCASILFLTLWQPTNRFGSQAIIQSINLATLTNCTVMLFLGKNNYLALAIFIVIENALSRCGWQGFYMVIAGEVIDTDMKNHNRRSPLSTIIFTLKALFNKPADQLAPLIIVSIFELGGYSKFREPCDNLMIQNNNGTTNETNSSSLMDVSESNCFVLYETMFYALIGSSALCALGESVFIGIDQIYRRKHKLKSRRIDD